MGDTLLNLRRFSTFVSNPKQCVQNGKSISYYANGEPAVTADFENGHREGEMRRFYKNGKLKYVCWFSKGKRDGELTMYYPNGSVWRTENYEEGKLLDGHVYKCFWTVKRFLSILPTGPLVFLVENMDYGFSSVNIFITRRLHGNRK